MAESLAWGKPYYMTRGIRKAWKPKNYVNVNSRMSVKNIKI